MSTRWKVHLESLIRWGHLGHRMYVMKEEGPSSFAVMRNADMKVMDNSSSVAFEDAFLDDSKHYSGLDVASFLQAMSDAAWEIGIKPKQVESHTDELKAVRYHLEDMRTLVLKK